jgi:hypothetical protein
MILSAPLQLLAKRVMPSVLLLSAVCVGLEFSAPGQANEFVLNCPQPVEVSSRLLSILELPITIPDPEPQPQLVLNRTKRQIRSTGDPIWDLRLEIPGEPARHFDAVSGRAHRQDADRDQMGSKAPLPTGRYTIGPVEPLAKGAYPEFGPVWIGIEPTFITGRRVLGIHQDPSVGVDGNSGTLGCIGLIREQDLLELSELIQASNVRLLIVED